MTTILPWRRHHPVPINDVTPASDILVPPLLLQPDALLWFLVLGRLWSAGRQEATISLHWGDLPGIQLTSFSLARTFNDHDWALEALLRVEQVDGPQTGVFTIGTFSLGTAHAELEPTPAGVNQSSWSGLRVGCRWGTPELESKIVVDDFQVAHWPPLATDR